MIKIAEKSNSKFFSFKEIETNNDKFKAHIFKGWNKSLIIKLNLKANEFFDSHLVKENFPQINLSEITYLDSAASTLKVKASIDAVTKYYTEETANIHRGIHHLSEINTTQYEATRDIVKNFLNAQRREEIIFTRGTTESVNLVTRTWGEANLKAGDEIIIAAMEHHSNMVPWQMLAQKTGAKLKIIPINQNGEIIIEEYKKLLSDKTKMISVVYISNSLGTINPIEQNS